MSSSGECQRATEGLDVLVYDVLWIGIVHTHASCGYDDRDGIERANIVDEDVFDRDDLPNDRMDLLLSGNEEEDTTNSQ